MPNADAREAFAGRVRENPRVELVDFSRDVYRTLIVHASTIQAGYEVIRDAEETGYDWRVDSSGAMRLILEASDEAPEKVRKGGNRL